MMKHSTITARYTTSSICILARLTTMLVAASIPALPAADMICSIVLHAPIATAISAGGWAFSANGMQRP
jgi:hypothetical protein